MAVAALSSHRVKRIILTRPAVEAGEKLGFLPGDMADKLIELLKQDAGATTVVSDQPKLNYFVASLMSKDVPTVLEFTTVYKNSMGPIPDQLLEIFRSERYQAFRQGLMSQLRKEAKLVINNDKKNNETAD